MVVILVSVFFGVYLWVRGPESLEQAFTGSCQVWCGVMSVMTEDVSKHWYIVHTYSGFEKKVPNRSSSVCRRTGCRTTSAKS